MKIVLHSTRYWPDIGGMESVGRLLVRGWTMAGDDVTVVSGSLRLCSSTRTTSRQLLSAGTESSELSATVIRDPSLFEFLSLARTADAVVQANISLPATWILKLFSKQLLVVHHTWYASTQRWKDLLKLFTSRFVKNVAVSTELRNHLPKRDATVIPNPFDSELFCSKPEKELRAGDILFVGRLVSDKGVDVLLRSVAKLIMEFPDLRVTIVGDGDEAPALKTLSTSLHLDGCVQFKGSQEGEVLAGTYRQHKIVVVPSQWEEPFGVVVLEALASGCDVVVTPSGALPSVLGSFGVVALDKSEPSITNSIRSLLHQSSDRREFGQTTGAAPEVSEYLHQFHPDRVAAAYRALFEVTR